MKKLILGVAAALAVGSVGVATAHQNQKYQNNKVHEAKVQQSKAQAVQAALKQHDDALQGAYDQSRVECEKGLAAYATLTPLQVRANKVPKPNCTQAIIK
jgi:hypothetical protein